MIKSKALLGMAMLCATHIFGQFETPREILFEISEPYKVVDAESKNYFHENGEIISIKVAGKETIVQKFDEATMNEKFRKELKMPKSYSLETVTKFGGRYLVFYSIYEKSRETEQLFFREIDFNNGTWKGPETKAIATRGKIAGSPLGTIGGLWSVGVTDKFDFYYSADRSKMLVQFRKTPKFKNDAKNFDQIGLYVFDDNMKEVWGEDARMPYTEKKMNNIDYTVDNEGNAYILSTVYNDNSTRASKRGSDEPNYHIELIKRNTASKRLEISEIGLDAKFITTVGFYESTDNSMILAGYYNNHEPSDHAEGVFYARLNKEGELHDERIFDIPLEILNQYESKRQRKRNEKFEETKEKGIILFANLKLRKMQFLADGSIVMIGEQYFQVRHTTTSNGRTSTYYTYHYNDMLITKISPEGELEWMRKLPKSQEGRNGLGMMSFKHYYDAGYHYIMFLDEVENKELPFDEAPRTYNDGKFAHLTAFVIDDERGEVTKNTILDMREANGMKLYQFAPSKILKISEDEFVFEAYKKKKEDVMVKISLKES